MKLFLILHILSISLVAQEALVPVMSKNQLQESLSTLETIQRSMNHCSVNLEDFKKENDFFTASISCQSQCKDQSQINNDTKIKNFDTDSMNLTRGNGRLWTPLSMSIKYWAQDICLGQAIMNCKMLENIKNFKVSNISSGLWNISDTKFGCSADQDYTPSPFSPKIVSSIIKNPIVENGKVENSVSPWYAKFEKKLSESNDESECKYKANGTYCFGDCAFVEGKDTALEFLSTPMPLGETKYTFCMDNLYQEIKGKNLSKDIIQNYCETIALTKLLSRKVTGTTCSSARLDIDCSALFSEGFQE